MEHLSKVMLVEHHRRELEREAAQDRLGAELPGQRANWRALAVVAIVLIGMIALWIH